MIPFIAQVETGLQLVEKASAASDRWLFLATLLILGMGASLCIRWLVTSLDKKDQAHAAAFRELHESHIKERVEWREQQADAKAGFLMALKDQRDEFRSELSLERTATAKMAETVHKLVQQFVPTPS